MSEASKTRWFTPTPAKLVALLLAVELCLLLLNRHSGWMCLGGVAAFLATLAILLVWFGIALLLRRWDRGSFQFTVITPLLLMVCVAVVGGWFGWKMQQTKRQQEAIVAIESLGGHVEYAYEFSGVYHVWDAESPPSWARQLVGLDFLSPVVDVDLRRTRVTDDDLKQLKKHLSRLPQLKNLCLAYTHIGDVGLEQLKDLTSLETLYLFGTEISDDGLAHLQGLKNLRILDPSGTRITDAGLAHLKELNNLTHLWLNWTHVTDVGLAHVECFPHLRELGLEEIRISDASLKHLEELEALEFLYLSNTDVTASGVKKLQIVLPNCFIVFKEDATPSPPDTPSYQRVRGRETNFQAVRWTTEPDIPKKAETTTDK